MCEPTTIAVGLAIGGGLIKAGADAGAASAQASQLEQNAKYADIAAADAIARGGATEDRIRIAAAKVEGEQKAAYSSAGVDTKSGTPMDVLGSTAALSELDALTARNNAAREAWGFRVSGSQMRRQASNVRLAGTMGAFGAILGGVRGAATYAYPMLSVAGHESDAGAADVGGYDAAHIAGSGI